MPLPKSVQSDFDRAHESQKDHFDELSEYPHGELRMGSIAVKGVHGKRSKNGSKPQPIRSSPMLASGVILSSSW